MITAYWYSVQKDGEVRFMESEALCKLDQAFLAEPWCEPRIDSLAVESDYMPVLLDEIATVRGELVYAEEALEDSDSLRESHVESEPTRRRRSQLRRKIAALEELRDGEETVKKTFEIEWPASLDKNLLNANNLMLCLTGTGYIGLGIKITVTEE